MNIHLHTFVLRDISHVFLTILLTIVRERFHKPLYFFLSFLSRLLQYSSFIFSHCCCFFFHLGGNRLLTFFSHHRSHTSTPKQPHPLNAGITLLTSRLHTTTALATTLTTPALASVHTILLEI